MDEVDDDTCDVIDEIGTFDLEDTDTQAMEAFLGYPITVTELDDDDLRGIVCTIDADGVLGVPTNNPALVTVDIDRTSGNSNVVVTLAGYWSLNIGLRANWFEFVV